jgi:hypothetical protein
MKYAPAKEIRSVIETEGRDAKLILPYLAVSTLILVALYTLSTGQAPDIANFAAAGVFP